MVRLLRDITCIVMTCAYILGYMGIGIHSCSEEHVSHLVLLVGDISCQSVHHHHHDVEHHHHGGCCTTEIIALSDAQDSSNGNTVQLAPEVSALHAQPIFALLTPALAAEAPEPEASATPPDLIRASLSVWRL